MVNAPETYSCQQSANCIDISALTRYYVAMMSVPPGLVSDDKMVEDALTLLQTQGIDELSKNISPEQLQGLVHRAVEYVAAYYMEINADLQRDIAIDMRYVAQSRFQNLLSQLGR